MHQNVARKPYLLRVISLPIITGLFAVLGLLSSCSFTDIPGVFPQTATVTPQPSAPEPTPTTFVETSEEDTTQTLTIWLPPEFDPENGSQAAMLFTSRLEQFEEENPQVVIITRIKEKTGPASLLNSLESTSAAAPGALPSMVALQRSDLETAALKGLVYPIEDHPELINDADKYDYSRELEMIQGTPYGLAFAGDSLILVFRPSVFTNPPVDWETILKEEKPLGFPAGDPQALFTVINYLSLGGKIQDEQNRPFIDSGPILKVFEIYSEAAKLGVFPVDLVQITSEGASWTAYKENQFQMSAAWISHYLSELPPDSTASIIPSLSDIPYTLADGWIWAISEPSPERKEITIELAKFLMERDFLNQWTVEAGYLPVRPSGVGEWTNLDIQNLISSTIASAHILPRNDILSTIGPILKDQINLIIRQEILPEEAVESTSQNLFEPQP